MMTRLNQVRFLIMLFAVMLIIAGCAPAAVPPAAPAATQPPAAATEAPAAATEAPAAAATQAPAASEELDEVQVLRFGSQEEDAPRGFDPTISTTTPSMDIQKEIYNGLVRLKPDAENYEDTEGDLATSWEVSDDGLVWTFHLREGVQFHKDFGELTSEDVKFSLDRARAEGASWATTFKNITNVEAVDKYTVRITTSRTDPYFLFKLSNGGDVSSVIVSKKAVEQYGEDYPFNPIGTGPFQFSEYFPKQKVVLTRNENYFRGAPILERVEYMFIPEIQSQIAAMKAGELEVMRGEQDPRFVDDAEASGLKVLNGVPFALPLIFNMTTEPFDDIRVRQAVKHAINPQDFVDFYGEEFVLPEQGTYTIFPWHMRAAQAARGQVKEYEYDPEKAKQLLTEAGYPNGLEIDLVWTNQARFRVPMEILQAQLAEVGIKLNVNIVEHSVYRDTIDGPGQPLSMISVSRDTPDAVALEWLHSDAIPPDGVAAKYNYAHYDQVDDLIAAALAEADPDKAVEAYVALQKKVAEDLPAIAVYQGMSEPFVTPSYVDLGYEWNAPDRRYPPILETARILKH